MPESGVPRVSVGDLLVATPTLRDPSFESSVVLLLDLDDNGALGVILNRPSPVPVEQVLPDWTDLVASPDVLFQGGPVSTDSALAVGASAMVDAHPHAGRSASAGSSTGSGSSTWTPRPRSSDRH